MVVFDGKLLVTWNRKYNLVCPIFCVLIGWIKFVKKTQQMHFGHMNVILLCSDHRHVLATHVANFRVVNASGVLPTHYKYICTLAFGTLKMTTWVGRNMLLVTI